MFDLITGKAEHIPARPAVPLVISTALQVVLAGAVLVPILFVTGALPQPPVMMAFVAAPPAPPPPPPPPPAPAPAKKAPEPARTITTSAPSPIPLEPPREIAPEPIDTSFDEEGVPGGVEGGIPGGVLGGVLGGLPEAPPPPPPPPVSRAPIRVGGVVKQPALLRRVEPIYPPLAVHAHLEGVVILEAIVDRDGKVEEVKVLRTAGALLDNAAMTAVRQWQYSPVMLNGIAERFMLTVVLSFNLEDEKKE